MCIIEAHCIEQHSRYTLAAVMNPKQRLQDATDEHKATHVHSM